MSFYISNQQNKTGIVYEDTYTPLLLELKEGKLQRVIFGENYEFRKILVDTFEIANDTDETIEYPILPSGLVMLMFLFSDTNSDVIACGAYTALKRIQIPPKTTAYCVRTCAGRAGWIIPNPVSEFTNCAIKIENNHYYFRDFHIQIKRGESFHERNVFLCRFLHENKIKENKTVEVVTGSIEMIHKSQGTIKINEIAKAMGYGERHINHLFQDYVGISPKMYCKLVQLQCSAREILISKPKSLLDIAVEFGYCDQTHMNRAYQKFLDCTACDMRYADSLSLHWKHSGCIEWT